MSQIFTHTSEQTRTSFGCYKFLLDGVQRTQKHYFRHYITRLLSVDFYNLYYLFYDIALYLLKKSEYKAWNNTNTYVYTYVVRVEKYALPCTNSNRLLLTNNIHINNNQYTRKYNVKLWLNTYKTHAIEFLFCPREIDMASGRHVK